MTSGHAPSVATYSRLATHAAKKSELEQVGSSWKYNADDCAVATTDQKQKRGKSGQTGFTILMHSTRTGNPSCHFSFYELNAFKLPYA